MADVPLLTASMADDINLLSTFGNHPVMDVRIAVDAIATGRTKTVAVRSEAEWRKRFEAWAEVDGGLPIVRVASGARYESWTTEHAWRAYIHAKREEGLVSGEQGGGNG